MDKEQKLLQQFEEMTESGIALGPDDVKWCIASIRNLRFRINKMRERISELENLIRRMDQLHHSRVSELEDINNQHRNTVLDLEKARSHE